MSRPASSSLWKLSGMTLGIVASAMMLMWFFTSWALLHSFDEVGRAVIADDLGEYGVIYERDGFEAVRILFNAGGHDDHDQTLRLLDPSGETLLDIRIPRQPQVQWPERPRWTVPPEDGIQWVRHSLGDGSTLTIGRRRFSDGAELWFGRTNAADLAAIGRVHRLILVAMAITSALAIGPVFWFANRVLRPVRSLISDANRLASGESLDHRLETSAAIPELQVFANAFNESLDRVQVLTEELEAANDQLAHELRTPLARIRGNVEHILTQPKSSPAIREDAARAIDEIKRATALIQNILSIRAGDSGIMKLNLERLSLMKLVQESYDLYSAAAEEKALNFKLIVPGEDRPMSLDRQRLQQALCNLLDNAIAFTPRGGTVEVALKFEDEFAAIQVGDTGPGLSEADSQRIWRRFTRGSAASADTPGIGLGLSLVKAVVAAHRGEVGARNRPEGGAEFWIRFPIDQREIFESA